MSYQGGVIEMIDNMIQEKILEQFHYFNIQADVDSVYVKKLDQKIKKLNPKKEKLNPKIKKLNPKIKKFYL